MVRSFFIFAFLFSSLFALGQKSSVSVDSVDYYIQADSLQKAISFLDKSIVAKPSAQLYLDRGLIKLEVELLDGDQEFSKTARIEHNDIIG